MSAEISAPQSLGFGDSEEEQALYRQLWRLAASKLRYAAPGATLSATVLVNETFLKLSTAKSTAGSDLWRDRKRFFALAAEVMRQIIVDYHRRRTCQKRGGGVVRNRVEVESLVARGQSVDVLAVSDALEHFETLHPTPAVLVKLRFFAGMTMAECAEALEISVPTAERHWRYARAWLAERLSHELPGRSSDRLG
ncbi:MAG: ECF-type sigma factor [Aureliella sp.]